MVSGDFRVSPNAGASGWTVARLHLGAKGACRTRSWTRLLACESGTSELDLRREGGLAGAKPGHGAGALDVSRGAEDVAGGEGQIAGSLERADLSPATQGRKVWTTGATPIGDEH